MLKRVGVAALVGGALSLFLACVGDDPARVDTSSSSSSGATEAGPSTVDKEITVQTNAACPSFKPCSASPAGTYDYTAGCVDDLFSALRSACGKLDTSKVVATVKGTVQFLSPAIKRDVVLSVTGSLTVPRACPAAGLQCNLAEAGLKGTFPNTKCIVLGDDCSCGFEESAQDTSSSTFTIEGSTIKWADGLTYTGCE